jgi:hypothetical protein
MTQHRPARPARIARAHRWPLVPLARRQSVSPGRPAGTFAAPVLMILG